MRINSLAITKRPVWFNVRDRDLEQFEFIATPRFWPAKANDVALFVFESSEPLDQELLAQHSITKGAGGCYIYVGAVGDGVPFHQIVTIPRGLIKRVGLRLWNSDAPVVLENIEIVGDGLDSPFSVSSNAVGVDEVTAMRRTANEPAVLGLNLLTSNAACTAACHAICQHWYKTMDDVQERHTSADYGRTNCALESGDGNRPSVTIFRAKPAMLRVPKDISEYLDGIGDKSRNMIRKAQRLGYVHRQVDPAQFLDDVFEIRTSDPMRQGRPLPEYFKIRPARVLEPAFENNCSLHRDEFYGVFLEDKLVAYATIFFYGELGQVNHILGHKEHLSHGIMNLLVSELVNNVIKNKPWVRAINYLYPGSAKALDGIGAFKKSIGFLPTALVVTQDEFDLGKLFAPEVKTRAPVATVVTKPSAKADLNKALRGSGNGAGFVHGGPFADRDTALARVLGELRSIAPQLHTVHFRSPDQITTPVSSDKAHILVIDGLKFREFKSFLSSGLKRFRDLVPKDTLIVFDFKRSLDLAHVPATGAVTRFLPRLLQPRSRLANEELIGYISRRFKSTDLSVDDVKKGFKGSDYVVAGFVDHTAASSHSEFDSLLVLRKIC